MQKITLSLHEIFPDPENMRFHDEKNLQIIMDGLLRHGQYRDFVIQKSNHIIRVGNGMYEAMKRLNWQKKVKCVVSPLFSLFFKRSCHLSVGFASTPSFSILNPLQNLFPG